MRAHAQAAHRALALAAVEVLRERHDVDRRRVGPLAGAVGDRVGALVDHLGLGAMGEPPVAQLAEQRYYPLLARLRDTTLSGPQARRDRLERLPVNLAGGPGLRRGLGQPLP